MQVGGWHPATAQHAHAMRKWVGKQMLMPGDSKQGSRHAANCTLASSATKTLCHTALLQLLSTPLCLPPPSPTPPTHIPHTSPPPPPQDSPGPQPQIATLSPSPTRPSSLACQAVGRMSVSSTTCQGKREAP